MAAKGFRVSATTRIRECPQTGVNFQLPLPIDAHLDKLKEIVENDAGQLTSRKELIAALVFAAAKGADELEQLLKDYRRATVKDLALGRAVVDNVVSFVGDKKPGPRPRRRLNVE